jgi:hypothetical protein
LVFDFLFVDDDTRVIETVGAGRFQYRRIKGKWSESASILMDSDEFVHGFESNLWREAAVMLPLIYIFGRQVSP